MNAFYTDPTMLAEHFVTLQPATAFGTATAASATGANKTNVGSMAKIPQRYTVKKLRLKCTVIPNAAATALVANFLNGTSTFATAVLTTATAGQWIDATITAANATIEDDIVPTINTTGTATASADVLGTYEIYGMIKFEWDPTA